MAREGGRIEAGVCLKVMILRRGTACSFKEAAGAAMEREWSMVR